MIRRAVILAAGKGARLNGHEVPKPLAAVGGIPLLRRSLAALERIGVLEVAVVIGYRGDEVRAAIEAERDRLRARIWWFENPDFDRPNGISLLAARPFLVERSLLIMADHLFAPTLLAPLVELPADGDETVLAVDGEPGRVFDLDDATKVRRRGDRIVEIGKEIEEYDGVDTGAFVISRPFIEALASLEAPGLSDGMRLLARRGLARAHDIGGAHWQDIDTRSARRHAEWMLRAYGEDLAGPAGAERRHVGTLAAVQALLDASPVPQRVLLNPGPVTISPTVKAALVHPDVCHRDPEWAPVLGRLQRKLRHVFRGGPEHEVLLLTGSGTAAMEAALTSSVPRGARILVVDNGTFGARLAEIAQLHHLDPVVMKLPWGTLPDPAAIDAALAADPSLATVAMIHHETSVGLLNPVTEVGEVVRRHDRLFVVDAVASLGGEDVDVVRDNIDVCFSSSNKCLHSVSGAAFLCVGPRLWPRVAGDAPRVLYFDIGRYRRAARELSPPFTPAVSTYFALDAALDELIAGGGVERRVENYRRRNARLRAGLERLGCAPFTSTGRESHTLCLARLPDGVWFPDLFERLKQRGFVIYAAKGPLEGRFFQVANMGNLPQGTIDRFLEATAEALGEIARERKPRRPALARV